jgi:hypothetical protein
MNGSLRKPGRYGKILGCTIALIATGTYAPAQDESDFPTSATLICRPAATDENATAKVMATSGLLVCRPFAASMHMSDGTLKVIGDVRVATPSGPDFSHALSPQQINAAYNSWLEKALDIDPAIRHSP